MKGNSSHKRTARAQEIQYNVVRLALVIFFVATVSAAGGFLQGERVAVERVAQTQQATAHVSKSYNSRFETVSKLPNVKISKPGFLSGLIGAQERATIYLGNQKYLSCNRDSNCNLISKSSDDIITDVKPLNVRETDDYIKKYTEGGNKNKKPTDAKTNKKKEEGDSKKKKDAKSFACKDNPNSLSCKNICSTTYVTLGTNGKNLEEIDCSPKNLIPGGSDKTKGNELWKKITTYAQQCSTSSSAKQIAANKCLGAVPLPEKKPKEEPEPKEKAKKVKTSASSINNLAALSAAQCTKLEREIDALIAKGRTSGAAASATNADKTACVYKGAVVCFKEGSSVADSEFSKVKPLQGVEDGGEKKVVQKDKAAKWKCVPKKEGGANTSKPGPDQSRWQCLTAATKAKNWGAARACMTRNDNRTDSGRNAFGGRSPFGQQKKPPTGKKNTSPKQQPKGCPAGHVQAQQNGRTVCVKPVKPQCVIAASKEEINAGETVTIRWRTANAEKVAISDIGDSVPKNSQKSVRPSKTTTYTLTATGKGDAKETCDVTVTVDGESNTDSSGVAPPKLSCTPGTILKGKSAKVKWACTSRADASEGMGIDTDGKLGGEVTVTPEHNTQYTVKCLEDGQEIGKNICSVTVGEPTYDILVHPTTAKRGDRVRVSWASLFMKSCRVQGPRGFDYTREQGVVITEPFSTDEERVPNRTIRAAIYSIECESEFGGRVSKDVTVEFEE